MKRFLPLFLILFNSLLQAQVNNSLYDYYSPDSPFKIGLDGAYNFNSTALTSDFLTTAIKGEKIEDQTNERVSGKLEDLNRFGGDVNIGGYFVVSPDTLFGRAGMSWYMGLRNRQHVNGVFGSDFFDLGFYGNSRFEGDTANLSGFEYNFLSYQQLEGGIIFNQGKTGVGLSILRGGQHKSLSMPLAYFYTAPDGEFADLDLLLNVNQTNSRRKGFQYTNGVGASLDFFTTINFGTIDTFQHRILLEIRDLGFIKWNKHATAYTIDTSYHFEDFFVENIFALQDSIFDSSLSDSSLVAQSNNVQKRYTTVLPAFFHLAEIYRLNEDFSLMGGIKYRLMANYNVYYYIQGIYQLTSNVEISAKAAYGGYGKLNSGLAVRALIKENFTLTLGTDNLEGFLLPAFTTGNSAFITIHRTF